MKRRIIRKAIEVLEATPEEQVYLGAWGTLQAEYPFGQGEEVLLEDIPPYACNTKACLAGTLALHPTFHALGYQGEWVGEADGYHPPRTWFLHLNTNLPLVQKALQKYPHWSDQEFVAALTVLFDVHPVVCESICERRGNWFDEGETDQEIAINRLKRLLEVGDDESDW